MAASKKEKPIIEVKHLSKQYSIGVDKTYKTLCDSLTSAVRHPLKMLKDCRRPNDNFWAIKDLNFEIKRGEVVGIIGRNGAGKSTLLKILSRITHPTEGEVLLHGRVGSLLEVGTGFHPELTGRENIYFNGAILGMKKREINEKFDEIVKFSGVEKFLNTPVKRYSSGMQVRLAFSVAAHLEPEILLVDEVLAVGDAAFQKKCLGKMEEIAECGRTVLFVSHNMSAVRNLCNKGILLDGGKLINCSSIDNITSQYMELAQGNHLNEKKYPIDSSKTAQILSIRAYNKTTHGDGVLSLSEPIIFEIEYIIREDLSGVVIALIIMDIYGTRLLSTEDVDCFPNLFGKRSIGRYVTKLELPKNLINKGEYIVRVACGAPTYGIQYHDDEALRIELIDSSGIVIRNRRGVLSPIYPWITEKVSDEVFME